jgi:hypothetical protein
MSENQRRSGAGSLFVVLIVVGVVMTYWWTIAIAFAALLRGDWRGG